MPILQAILVVLVFARMGLGLQFQTLISVGPDVATAFALSFAEIGLYIGLFMAPGIVLSLPAGFMNRYASDRVICVTGLVLLAAGGALAAIASEGWMVGAGRTVAGAGFVLSNIYCTKMVADWFAGREIATAMSALVMSWPFGIAVGQIAHVWLAQSFGWQSAFWVASAYCAVLAVALRIP